MVNLAQEENLQRVNERIAEAVVAFCRLRLAREVPDFYMDDLRDYVLELVGRVAPDSAGRILRNLRQQGRVEYRVVSRHLSLYRVERVEVES